MNTARTHRRRARLLALCALASAAPRAQDDVTALGSLTARADAVAVVRALHVDDSDAEQLRVTFAVEQTLHGTPPPQLTLRETRGQACGRTLWAVLPGRRFVACLSARAGAFALCAQGARALPPATAAIVAHVQALLAAAPGASRVAVLCAALRADDARVRGDAALALAYEPDLERADAAQRADVVAALRAALADDERAVPGLLAAAVRLRLTAALDALLPRYLDGEAGAFARAFQDGMARIDAEALATRIAARLDGLRDPMARARAVELLLQTDVAAARAPLLALASAGNERGTRLRACVGLLRLGTTDADLRTAVDAELLAVARQAPAHERPRFRFIRTD